MALTIQDSVFGDTNWPAVDKLFSTRGDTYSFIDPARANLAGKSVLITGASRGIGKATAISFATAGCSKILLVARSDLADVETAVKDAAKKAGRPEPLVHFLKADVTSHDSVRAAAESATDILGGSLDILINNAGYLEQFNPVGESDPSEWWWTWEVNIKGVYLTTRYFLPLLLKSQTKTIISITSAGAHVIFPGASGYQTTKFALCRFTEFLDKEYRQQGLIAIAAHPGGVKTDLGLSMPAEAHSFLTDTVELAADTLVWLSRERRDWLSGRFASVCWNMEELEQKKRDIVKKNLLKFRMII